MESTTVSSSGPIRLPQGLVAFLVTVVRRSRWWWVAMSGSYARTRTLLARC